MKHMSKTKTKNEEYIKAADYCVAQREANINSERREIEYAQLVLELNDQKECNENCQQHIVNLEKEIEIKKEKLLEYGSHKSSCARLSDPNEEFDIPCTCGFSEALGVE